MAYLCIPMKKLLSILSLLFFSISQAQEQAVDSTQYKIGYTIGENLPVAIILVIAIFFIFKSYRKSATDDKKTDFLDDGTITKD